MTSVWTRTRRATGGRAVSPVLELSIPTHFRCPISLDLMKDPVTVSTGISYDRQRIETWLDMGNSTCPVTNQAITTNDLIPNHSLRRMIQDWCVANRSHGVERIPTPRIPITQTEAVEMLSEIATAGRKGDGFRCGELVAKLKELARESERNRRCISSNGAGIVLAAAFNDLARVARGGKATGVLEEVLSAMAAMFPLDEEARSYMASPESLNSLMWILRYGEFAGRLNAVLAVKELVHRDKTHVDAVAENDGMVEALVKLINISPQTTKATLIAAFYLVSSNQKAAMKFVELGMVHLLLEILVDSDRSTSEKALGVMDGICNTDIGRDTAVGHALAVPVLVKKMFRVSAMATEFAVSALWKLCKNYRGEGCMEEALQVGAFQKLLLLLQVGCGDQATKEKATELLKLMNGRRGRVECIESVDFKGLKRPF